MRSLAAFLALPGLAAFGLPPLIATFDPLRGEPRYFGMAIIGFGIVLLLWCVRDFYVSGKGTLAPWDPPRHLVVIGLYRYVRNPMYIAVLTLITGWTMVLGSPYLAAYTLLLAIGFHARVLIHEEPWLSQQFGDDWRRYSASVNRWWPRFPRLK